MKTKMSVVSSSAKHASGYTFLLVLIMVVIVGVFAERATQLNSRLKQIELEKQLIFNGMAYKKAIESYYNAGQPDKVYPHQLIDLVKDPRFIHKKHLRELYIDPITGEDWQIIHAFDGGIAGVVSKSKTEVIKRKNFPFDQQFLNDGARYSDWLFEFKPIQAISNNKQ